MWVATTRTEAQSRCRELRQAGRLALAPTMGALHEGHLSLIEAGRRAADAVVVSIFVNPTQFGPHEDFHRYPRPIEQDLAMCESAGAAGVFHPPVEQMYPPGEPACEVNVPALAADMEAAARPGHFAGVCRVVAKLFHIIQPHVACFGMKDYQQLAVVRAMTADLAWPIDILACPTIRERDGLAMSSRNRYLSDEQRGRAIGLHRSLLRARSMIVDQHVREVATIESAMRQTIGEHGFDAIDYATLRDPRTLAPLQVLQADTPVVALAAARLGTTRLLDNLVIRNPTP